MNRQHGSHVPGEVYVHMFIEQLHSALDTLSEREAGVISMRFGLTDGKPHSLKEAARVYGVTTDRIRKIELKAMAKLRNPRLTMFLRDYLDMDNFPALEEYVRLRADQGGLVYCQYCSCAFDDHPESSGRKPKYCSNACRQAAYRRRRARTD